MQRQDAYVLNSGHLFCLACTALSFFIVPRAMDMSAQRQAKQESKAYQNSQLAAGFEQAQFLKRGNKLAMERVRTGACIEIVGMDTDEPAHMAENIDVVSRLTKEGIRPNQLVCNRLLETAIVGPNGKLEQIAVANVKDKEEFLEYLR